MKRKKTAKPMYVEIPVLASYRYDFSDALQLQVNFGPYFGYGIGGKMKFEDSYGSLKEEYEEDIFGDDEEDLFGYAKLKRFNCGLQVGAGLTMSKHYYLGVHYQFGLANVAQENDDVKAKAKDRNWMISLGYNF